MVRTVGVLLLVLFATSCVPTSVQPLTSVESAAPDARLTGVWTGRGEGEEGDRFWLHFVPAEDGRTDIVLVAHEGDGADTSFYKMHPSRLDGLDGRDYMNIRPHVPKRFADSEIGEEIADFEGYYIASAVYLGG